MLMFYVFIHKIEDVLRLCVKVSSLSCMHFSIGTQIIQVGSKLPQPLL